jgi:hypothetical protein
MDSSKLKFEHFFMDLMEEYEIERKIDKSIETISELTKPLWGGLEDQTPYAYLEDDATSGQIIMAIEGYVSEYQNGSAWEIMDVMVQKMTYFELKNLDIYEVIETFDGVIHRDARPDLDY